MVHCKPFGSTGGNTLLLNVAVLVALFQATTTVPKQGSLATVFAPMVNEIEVVDPVTTLAFYEPNGATTMQRKSPEVMLRVGMSRSVAPGEAVIATLQDRVVV